MQIDEFCRTFFQMEMEEDLFGSRTPNGDPFWDVVRYEVFGSLFHEMNEPGLPRMVSANRTVRSMFAKLCKLPSTMGSIANHWVQLKRLGRADFVAFICSRNRDASGNAIDFASEDAVHALSMMGSIRRIESQPKVLMDLNINSLITVAARVCRQPAGNQRYFFEIANALAHAEKKHFGMVDPHLLDVIRRTYKRYLVERRIWSEILDRSRSRLVLMMQNGIQKGLIREARSRHVPVVECQHGAINLLHPTYTYPPNLPPGEAVLLPDVLLLFSAYWLGQCRMPGTKLVAIGNSRISNCGPPSTRTGAAVFISAGPFQRDLSPLALKLASSMPTREFIMKLHPSHLSDRGIIEQEYGNSPNLAVVGTERSLSELMDNASDVVIVESTAAYEALERRIPVHFLRKGGYIRHQDLFSRPDVHLFSNAEELRGTLFQPSSRPESSSRFFDSFDASAFLELVRSFDRE